MLKSCADLYFMETVWSLFTIPDYTDTPSTIDCMKKMEQSPPKAVQKW